MSRQTLVIVGGVAAGTSAATKARRVSENITIIVFEKHKDVAYAGCGIPYLVSGLVKDKEELLIRSAEIFKRRDNIDIVTHHEVVKVDSLKKTLLAKELTSNADKEYTYDKLVLTTGSTPIIPPMPGSNLPHIYTLNTIEDADLLLGYIKDSEAKRVTIVGGGFIGLEIAESFLQLGMEITIVEKMSHILPSLDLEMAEIVATHLRDKGAKIITSDSVKSFGGDTDRGVKNITTEHGKEITSDLVLLSIGVIPNVNLAKEAGVAIGSTGAIAVDDHMRTNLPGIYAAGDCAETRNIITGEVTWLPLGSIAQKQGRVAGENAAGGNATFPGVLGTTIAKVCELTVAKTGLSQEEAEQRGLHVISSTIHPFDHAHYYPEAHEVALKLVADKETGRLLGAQAVGKGGVDRSIDVLAVAIFKGATIDELGCLDLAYSPPYSTAKDAVNIAGNVITNKYTGMADSISSAELKLRLESGSDFTLLDVRSNIEYQADHLPKAKLIPIWELRERLTELESSKEIITFCRQGLRAYLAYRILKNKGFTKVAYHDGGIASWPYEVK